MPVGAGLLTLIIDGSMRFTRPSGCVLELNSTSEWASELGYEAAVVSVM